MKFGPKRHEPLTEAEVAVLKERFAGSAWGAPTDEDLLILEKLERLAIEARYRNDVAKLPKPCAEIVLPLGGNTTLGGE